MYVVVCTANTGVPDPNMIPEVETTLYPCATETAAFEHISLQMRKFSFGNEHYSCMLQSHGEAAWFRAYNQEAHVMFVYEIKKVEEIKNATTEKSED